MKNFNKNFGADKFNLFKSLLVDQFILGKDSVVKILQKDFSEFDELFFFMGFSLLNSENLYQSKISKKNEYAERLLIGIDEKNLHSEMAICLNLLRRGEVILSKQNLNRFWETLQRRKDFPFTYEQAILIINCFSEVEVVSSDVAEEMRCKVASDVPFNNAMIP